MKQKLIKLSRHYIAALRRHLKQGPGANLDQARGVGRRAVILGLDTLDLVKIHQKALASVEASASRDGIIERAEIFFAEAVTPIEKTHRAALKNNAQLDRVSRSLARRTIDLAISNRSLKKTIAHRKTAEEDLKQSGGHSKKLLEESRRLQGHLRHLTHRILTAQEDKRKKISRDLQDEIAQTLLGINVRLLTLKKEAAANAKGFKQEIANTQSLVNKAAKRIKRFAREIGKRHEA